MQCADSVGVAVEYVEMFHASPYHEGASPNHGVDDLIGARPVSRTGSERASRMSAAPIAVIASARHKIGSRFERCARYRSIYRRLQHIVVQHFPLEQ